MAVEQEEELSLQRRTGTARVEVVEKRIVGLLQHDRRVEARRQTLRKRRLAGADGPFYGEVPEGHRPLSWRDAGPARRRRARLLSSQMSCGSIVSSCARCGRPPSASSKPASAPSTTSRFCWGRSN